MPEDPPVFFSAVGCEIYDGEIPLEQFEAAMKKAMERGVECVELSVEDWEKLSKEVDSDG